MSFPNHRHISSLSSSSSPLDIQHLSFITYHVPHTMHHASFIILHPPSIICHPSFIIGHSSFINHRIHRCLCRLGPLASRSVALTLWFRPSFVPINLPASRIRRIKRNRRPVKFICYRLALGKIEGFLLPPHWLIALWTRRYPDSSL